METLKNLNLVDLHTYNDAETGQLIITGKNIADNNQFPSSYYFTCITSKGIYQVNELWNWDTIYDYRHPKYNKLDEYEDLVCIVRFESDNE